MKKIFLTLLFLFACSGTDSKPLVIGGRTDTLPFLVGSRTDGKPMIFHGDTLTPDIVNPIINGSNSFSTSNPGNSWSDCRNAASAAILTGWTQYYIANIKSGSNYYIHRIFMNFDTSGLPDDATIISAKLVLISSQSYGGVAGLTQSFQPDPENSATTDYNDIILDSPPEGATRVTHSYSNEFIFNDTGLSWISRTGYTQFCIRGERDIDNIAPTGNTFLTGDYIDYYRTTQAPSFEITYE